jgi:cytochrome c oxidase subunit IV
MIRLPEEVLVFGRMAAFGLIVGIAYWFIAYEPAGTLLLLGFGAATAVASAILWIRSRAARRTADGWPIGAEPGRIPAPAYAPFFIGVGGGIVALGVAFGPLLVVIGAVVAVIGARLWLEAAMREADPSVVQDEPDSPPS